MPTVDCRPWAFAVAMLVSAIDGGMIKRPAPEW